MNEQEEIRKKTMLNAKILTGMGVFAAVVSIAWSFIPLIGVFALPWGIIGIIFTTVSFFLRKRAELKRTWSILALILCMIGTCLGFNKYMKHKWAVDFVVAGPVGKVKMIGELEAEPLDGISKESMLASNDNDDSSRSKELEEKGVQYNLFPRYHVPISSIYYSLFENLRLRSTPDLKGEVLAKLEFGEQIKYLGEKTDVIETITLGGREYNDVWYKVSNLGTAEIVGWVYGGAIINATSEGNENTNKGVVKPFNFIDKNMLFSLIGRSGESNEAYSGLMTYKRLPSGVLTKEGLFYFKGISSDDYFGNQQYGTSEYHIGTMKNGMLDGLYKCHAHFFESGIELEINFDQGVCNSYRMDHNQEGELDRAQSNKPEDCSYDYIYSKLEPVN